jgi:hypothetical protein
VTASLISLIHVATRYEAWFFLAILIGFMLFTLALSKNPCFRSVKPVHILLFGLPSIVFIGLWLQYNLAMTGNLFGFRDWIFADNGHENLSFYGNAGSTLITVLEDLFLSLGTFWITLLGPLVQFKNRSRGVLDEMLILYGSCFLGYIAYFAYSMFTGFNNGWPRHLLYFVPLSIITLERTRFTFHRLKGTLYFVLVLHIVLGIAAFWANLQAHILYIAAQ